MNQGTANVCLDDRKLKRILHEPGEDRIDLHLEAKAEAVTLTLVPKGRFENLEFTLERDVEPPP